MMWFKTDAAKLAKMWAAGLTASEIAAALGGAYTRNAVIGKARRMKLTPRPSPIKRAA